MSDHDSGRSRGTDDRAPALRRLRPGLVALWLLVVVLAALAPLAKRLAGHFAR